MSWLPNFLTKSFINVVFPEPISPSKRIIFESAFFKTKLEASSSWSKVYVKSTVTFFVCKINLFRI